MTRNEQVAQVEEDRREREEALLLLLLALSDRARRRVNSAIRNGDDWRRQIGYVLLGNEALDLPGGVGPMAALMANSHAQGVRRVGALVGVEVAPEANVGRLRARYGARAREALERIAEAIEKEITKGLGEAAAADRIIADVQAATGSFRVTGFVEDHPYGAAREATTLITVAYAQGTAEAYRKPEVQAVMTGLVFINPMDKKTTRICQVRHGVTLPLDAPYWFRAWPPLHENCRSIVLPTTRAVKFTLNPPEDPPPHPGWGQWAGMLGAPVWANA